MSEVIAHSKIEYSLFKEDDYTLRCFCHETREDYDIEYNIMFYIAEDVAYTAYENIPFTVINMVNKAGYFISNGGGYYE